MAALPPIVGTVLAQHAAEAMHLRQVRSVLVRAAHVRLRHLGQLDERIAAHLDGLAVGGKHGATAVREALERPDTGALFVAAVRALEEERNDRLEDLLLVGEALPACRAGVLSAFGWVAPAKLRGLVKGLLLSASAWRRGVGLAACAMHGVDPGPVLARFLVDDDPSLRARALRYAGRQARLDQLPACLAALNDADPTCALAAASSALLLGDRAASLDALQTRALGEHASEGSVEALLIALRVLPADLARNLLAAVINASGPLREVIRGAGVAGDPYYVPWLLARMHEPKLARIAGEAFTSITGLDLTNPDFECESPSELGAGPNDDPQDTDVALDDDDSLPWPDPRKISGWWVTHGRRFTPGTRYFMGAALTPQSCLLTLCTGSQRQRHAAAEHATLLAAGMPVFDTFAPAWRQQRLLDSMAV